MILILGEKIAKIHPEKILLKAKILLVIVTEQGWI